MSVAKPFTREQHIADLESLRRDLKREQKTANAGILPGLCSQLVKLDAELATLTYGASDAGKPETDLERMKRERAERRGRSA